MDLEKILKLCIEYLSDYLEDLLDVLKGPAFQLKPLQVTSEEPAMVTTPSSGNERWRLNPRLIRFLVISIFVGSVVNEKIPGRPPAQQLLVIMVVLILYWVLFSSLVHPICKLFGSQIVFIETLSACLQVFAVVYLLSSCCAFVWAVVVPKLPLESAPSYLRFFRDHPIYTYFVVQFLLTLAYLMVAIGRVHKFGFQRRPKTMLSTALSRLEAVAFCIAFLLITTIIVGVSKFNYESHNLPLDQPELVMIDDLFYTKKELPTITSEIPPQTRRTLPQSRPRKARTEMNSLPLTTGVLTAITVTRPDGTTFRRIFIRPECLDLFSRDSVEGSRGDPITAVYRSCFL